MVMKGAGRAHGLNFAGLSVFFKNKARERSSPGLVNGMISEKQDIDQILPPI